MHFSSSCTTLLAAMLALATTTSPVTASTAKKQQQHANAVKGQKKKTMTMTNNNLRHQQHNDRRGLKSGSSTDDLTTINCSERTADGTATKSHIFVEDGTTCIISGNSSISGSITLGVDSLLVLDDSAHVMGDVIITNDSQGINTSTDTIIDGTVSVTSGASVDRLILTGSIGTGITVEGVTITTYVYIDSNIYNQGNVYIKDVTAQCDIILMNSVQTDSIYIENIDYTNAPSKLVVKVPETMENDVTITSITNASYIELMYYGLAENNFNTIVQDVTVTDNGIANFSLQGTGDLTVSNVNAEGSSYLTSESIGHLHLKDLHAGEKVNISVETAEKVTLDNVTSSDDVVQISGTTITNGDLKIKNCDFDDAASKLSESLIITENTLQNGNLVIEKITTTTFDNTVQDIYISSNTISGSDNNLKIKDLDIGGKLTIEYNQVNDGYMIVEDNTIGGAYDMNNNVLSKGIAWKDNVAASF